MRNKQPINDGWLFTEQYTQGMEQAHAMKNREIMMARLVRSFERMFGPMDRGRPVRESQNCRVAPGKGVEPIFPGPKPGVLPVRRPRKEGWWLPRRLAV